MRRCPLRRDSFDGLVSGRLSLQYSKWSLYLLDMCMLCTKLRVRDFTTD